MVFSTKALIYSVVGAVVGLPLYLVFSILGMNFIGILAIGICAIIGFAIGTFKVPDTNAFEITKKTGGENIDDVIKRAVKFKMQKNKIYVYEEEKRIESEETKDE